MDNVTLVGVLQLAITLGGWAYFAGVLRTKVDRNERDISDLGNGVTRSQEAVYRAIGEEGGKYDSAHRRLRATLDELTRSVARLEGSKDRGEG